MLFVQGWRFVVVFILHQVQTLLNFQIRSVSRSLPEIKGSLAVNKGYCWSFEVIWGQMGSFKVMQYQLTVIWASSFEVLSIDISAIWISSWSFGWVWDGFGEAEEDSVFDVGWIGACDWSIWASIVDRPVKSWNAKLRRLVRHSFLGFLKRYVIICW